MRVNNTHESAIIPILPSILALAEIAIPQGLMTSVKRFTSTIFFKTSIRVARTPPTQHCIVS